MSVADARNRKCCDLLSDEDDCKIMLISVLQLCHVRPYQQAFAAINNHRQSRSLDLENCVLSSVLCKCVDLLQLQCLASASHLYGR